MSAEAIAKPFLLTHDFRQTFDSLIGEGALFQKLISEARLTARTDCRVLLIGEKGSGKATFARSIHNESSRRHSPFRVLQCATFQPTASRHPLRLSNQEGSALQNDFHFDLPLGGTLYLDGVESLSRDAQTWLLRLLEASEVESLHQCHGIRDRQLRIIPGSTKNLKEDLTAGRFRAELFYRLNVVSLHIPPLRYRREDIGALTAHFVSMYAEKYGKTIQYMSEKTFEVLRTYLWPKNIEEMKKVLEQAIIFAKDNTLHIEHIAQDHTDLPLQSQIHV